MKKLCIRLLAAITSLLLLVPSIFGCMPKDETGEGILNVGYYLGGYGERWARKLAEDFMAENPGVTVNMEGDPDIVGNIPRYLEDGSKYDIFFSHGIEWEVSAVSGWLEPLDDLYEMEVAPGVTVEDRVLDSFLETSKFKGQGDTEERYYKLHWTNGVGGIVYNKKYFDAHPDWKIPTTYNELVELCNKITEAKIPQPGNPDEYVRPFVFSKEDYYWDYLVFDWMVQLCGKDALDELLELKTPEVFNPETSEVVKAQKEALSKWTDLIAKNSKNSMVNSIGKEYDVAQMDFINGNAVMMPNAQWLENEMLANIDEEKCVMVMMPSPFMDNAKTEDGEPIRYSRAVGGDDSIIIPKKAPNKELAKKFLAFMCREDNALKFTQNTHGVMLGLDYDAEKLNALEGNTEFMKSVFEINTNSVKYDTYSPSRLRLDGKIKCEWFTTSGFAPYPDIIKNPNTDLNGIFSSYYDYVKGKWTSWGGPKA